MDADKTDATAFNLAVVREYSPVVDLVNAFTAIKSLNAFFDIFSLYVFNFIETLSTDTGFVLRICGVPLGLMGRADVAIALSSIGAGNESLFPSDAKSQLAAYIAFSFPSWSFGTL